MRSLRTKITIITVSVVAFAILVVSFFSVFFIKRAEHRKADEIMLLLCETGESNLDYYFSSVKKSVGKVATFAEADITGMTDVELASHIERVRGYFDVMASKTNGVLTYYYRIDPEVSATQKGFWYIDLGGNGFQEHEVTDITLYDTADTSSLVWFTVPKYEGKSIWLPPYVTDNLDVRVISYNTPIYWRGNFIGVVGIEIDYTTMAEEVESIHLFDNGYAFLNDEKGALFYHPRIDVSKTHPETPAGVLSDSTFVEYTFDGVKRELVWLPLSNGMRLNVSVPVDEIEGEWMALSLTIVVVSVIVLIAASLFIMFYANRIAKPIKQLTAAAEHVDKGNYEVDLKYDKDDEVGRLTKTFKRLASHVKDNIGELHKKVYVDALTHVKNKAAYEAAIAELQKQIDEGKALEFAIGVFDCDDLKSVNDKFGHEKGDVYLKTAGRAICGVFLHSPVFRIGGDEFTVILKGEDYAKRDELSKIFESVKDRINSSTDNLWEQARISLGIAVYDATHDRFVADVARRADKTMYDNKWSRKN